MDARPTPRAARRHPRVLLLSALLPGLLLVPAASAVAGPTRVDLGTADAFAVLGGAGLTNVGPTTISGDVGSSPTSSQSGFAPCPAADCVTLTSGANHDVADPNDAVTQGAKAALTTAFNDAAGRTGGIPVTAPLGAGQTLTTGVYTAATSMAVGGDLTLDAGGDPNAVWIFQAGTTLTTAAGITAGVPNTRVLLTNGAQACNVFWQVGTSATINTYTRFIGNVLAADAITVDTGATFLSGRALASGAAVTLDTNTIERATCAPPPAPPFIPPFVPAPAPAPPASTPEPTPTTATPTPPPDVSGTPPPEGTGGTPQPGPTAGTPPSEPSSPTPTPAPGAPGATGAPVAGAPSPVPTPPAPGLVTAPLAPVAVFAATPAGTARVSGPRGDVRGPFRVDVTGRSIQSVTFTVDGRRVKTVNATPGRTVFGMTVDPGRRTGGVHRVTVRVTFTRASRTRATTTRITYRRVAAPRAPRFTG